MSGIQKALLAESQTSGQPDIRILATSSSEALLATIDDPRLPPPMVFGIDFNRGISRRWQFPRGTSPAEMAEALANQPPQEEVPLSESPMAWRAPTQLENALAIY